MYASVLGRLGQNKGDARGAAMCAAMGAELSEHEPKNATRKKPMRHRVESGHIVFLFDQVTRERLLRSFAVTVDRVMGCTGVGMMA